jgi:N-acyl-D-aspartate/D-glutamate deacylase
MATFDLVLRNATVVDGTGAPRRTADVAVSGDRIVEVGDVAPGSGAEEIDLAGLVLSPGFIDIHTHFDAQVLWDPALTPSSWYGVTTVVMGNCGFGIAPLKPPQRSTMMRTLETVEDMPLAALEAAIDWTFETFDEYVDTVSSLPLALNVGVFVGHTPVRYFVLGDEAADREATEDEIQEMADIVEKAMRSGAMGFATSVSNGHVGAYSKPVPSRLATEGELQALVAAVGRTGLGCIMIAGPGGPLSFKQFRSLSVSSGRPVLWSALLAGHTSKGTSVELLEAHLDWEGDVRPQIACRPVVAQANFANPLTLQRVECFKEASHIPAAERAALYADAEWRARAVPQMEAQWGPTWDGVLLAESAGHGDLVGMTLAQIAAQRGQHPAEAMIDLSLEEDLTTRFTVVVANGDEEQLEGLLRSPIALVGLSDAGAHMAQLCDACFAPYLLGHWVRERQVLELETAIWKLTSQPAEYLHLAGRGRIEPGAFADLVAFDATTVGVQPLRRVFDQPGGADRVVSDPTGIEHVWVNGQPIRRDGAPIENAGPGRFVRPE